MKWRPAFLAFVFVVCANTVSAQTTTPTTTEPVATSTDAVIEVTNESVAAPTPITQAPPKPLSVDAQQRILNLAANMSNRVDAAAARLGQIAKRINSRLKKLEAKGVNTTLAAAALRSVESNLSHTKLHISDIDTQMYNTVTAANPQLVWQTTKHVFMEAPEHLREVKAGLRLVIDTLVQAETDHANGATAPTDTASGTDLIAN